MRVAAGALLILTLAACGGGGASAMSVEDASRAAPTGEVVSVKGTLVVEYGQAMLCSGLMPEDAGSRCESPALWVDGALDPSDWEGDPAVHWREDVVLRGTVGGGMIAVAP